MRKLFNTYIHVVSKMFIVYYLKCSMDIKNVQDFFFYFGFGYSMSIQLFTMFLNFVQYILHNVQCVFANCSTYFHKCSVRVRKFFSAYIPIFFKVFIIY